jgi:ubiquinone/menaquinone biosynthesis C-methylase UbiE
MSVRGDLPILELVAYTSAQRREITVATEAQLTQWQLGGNSAEAYERYLVPAIFLQGASQLVDHAGVSAGERVLDIGCGTGIVARTAAQRVAESGSVVGVDNSPGMLEVARSASAGVHSSIEWREGAAEDLPVARNSFDAVLCQQAFQFFSDRQKALEEMQRVLSPGGRAAFSVLRSAEHNLTYQPVIDAFSRHGGENLGVMMQSPFQEWSASELRDLATQAGFRSVSVTIGVITARFTSIPEFLQHELASSPLGEVVASMSEETREAIVRDVSAELRDYLDDEGVMHPLQTYLVLARA